MPGGRGVSPWVWTFICSVVDVSRSGLRVSAPFPGGCFCFLSTPEDQLLNPSSDLGMGCFHPAVPSLTNNFARRSALRDACGLRVGGRVGQHVQASQLLFPSCHIDMIQHETGLTIREDALERLLFPFFILNVSVSNHLEAGRAGLIRVLPA